MAYCLDSAKALPEPLLTFQQEGPQNISKTSLNGQYHKEHACKFCYCWRSYWNIGINWLLRTTLLILPSFILIFKKYFSKLLVSSRQVTVFIPVGDVTLRSVHRLLSIAFISSSAWVRNYANAPPNPMYSEVILGLLLGKGPMKAISHLMDSEAMGHCCRQCAKWKFQLGRKLMLTF